MDNIKEKLELLALENIIKMLIISQSENFMTL